MIGTVDEDESDPPLSREDVDLMALDFLDRSGGDAIGIIDNEDKMAAAMVYADLHRRGLIASVRRETGPFYTIAAAGRERLMEAAL